MYILMGKYKNNDWEEIDRTDNEADRAFLIQEYKSAFGQGWMFEWKKA